MSDISAIVSETIKSLKADELIEVSGLSIAVDELYRCVEILKGLGEEDARRRIESLIEQLELKKEIGYTWGINSELFHHIIRAPEPEIRKTFQECCPAVSLDDDDVARIKSVMQKFRRVPLNQEEVEQVVSVLGNLHGGTDNDQLQDELFEMITLLQLRLQEESF